MNHERLKFLYPLRFGGFSLCLIGLFVSPTRANAHPVVFAGGTAVMGHHQGKEVGFEVVHSPSYWSGLGFELSRHEQTPILMGKATGLLWRGNFPDFQSNFYLGAGAGYRWGHKDKMWHTQTGHRSENAPVYQWSADWDGEDRLIYSVLKYSEMFEKWDTRHRKATARLGFAPYKAKNDEPTFWGIVEWTPEKSHGNQNWEHEVTPLVRIFYKNALVEVGGSLSGKFTFNYMFHFFN